MINLNDAPSLVPKYPIEAIKYALCQTIARWLPEIIPGGRLGSERGNKSYRLANIKNSHPPKERGSCRIWLTGNDVGKCKDFSIPEVKGDVLFVIQGHFGLDFPGTIVKALEIISAYNGNHYLEDAANGKIRFTNGSAGPAVIDRKAERSAENVQNYLRASLPAPGTVVETYWNARKLRQLPPAFYGSPSGNPDIRFVEWAMNYDTGRGHHSMLSRFRDPDGQLTGAIHLTPLLDDGSWHIGGPPNARIAEWKDYSKIVWGPRVDGGLIMLAPINERGELGIGEGIETTAAGMQFYSVPGWAAGDTASMRKFGDYLVANPLFAAGVKRLLTWGDSGNDGEAAARYLASKATAAGIPAVELYFPRGGDDLAADLYQGLPPPEPTDFEPIAPTLPLSGPQPADGELLPPAGSGWGASLPQAAPAIQPGSIEAVHARLMTLTKGISGDALTDAVRAIANARLDPLNKETMVNLMYRQTGIKKRTIEDMIREQSPDATKPWLDKVAINNDGTPKGIMSNVAIVLREAEEIKGSLGFNEFTGMISVVKKLPWELGYPNPCQDRPWTDEDELATLEWVQGVAGIHALRNVVFDAVQRIASEHKYHPPREMLSNLEWDRIPRIETASIRYFGAPNTRYYREVFKRWLLSGVARIYNPGVKADQMLVFEGPQGQGKSTAIRILFDPWFTDQLAEIGTKDSSLELRGIWAAEYADLEGMGKAEARTIKSFMSRTTDRFRPPYGRVPIMVERQNIFAGTTNEDEYLKDATGGRRFWQLRCAFVDRDTIFREKDQLWAEAVHLYRAREKWYFVEAELIEAAAVEADQRFQSDALEKVIGDWLEHCPMVGCAHENKPGHYPCIAANCPRISVSTADILSGALKIDPSKWDKALQTRVGIATIRAIRNGNLPWIKRQIDRQWYYVRTTF